jgi:hypothetical protein
VVTHVTIPETYCWNNPGYWDSSGGISYYVLPSHGCVSIDVVITTINYFSDNLLGDLWGA